MGLLDSWARNYRNARGLSVAIAFLGATLFLASLRCNPMVLRETVLGRVLEIEAEGLHPLESSEPRSRVLVITPDSTIIRLLLPPPVPRIGDVIPLTAEHHKKGDIDYFLDLQKWRIDGPR